MNIKDKKVADGIKKDALCYMCGEFENITLHHIGTWKNHKKNLRPLNERIKRGVLRCRGEVIPLCVSCHQTVEQLKDEVHALEGYKRGVQDELRRRNKEVKKTIELIQGAFWAGTDYLVQGKEDENLTNFADRLITAYNKSLLRALDLEGQAQ